MTASPQPVLRVHQKLLFEADGAQWAVPDLTLEAGQWLTLSPLQSNLHIDTAIAMAQVFGTMQPPARGSIELLGHDVYGLSDSERHRLRARLGYVHGDGGLLSNRTLADNIALPVSVHRRQSPDDERELVQGILAEFGLTPVADFRPHQVNGLVRWRTCLARAVALEPALLVIEGPKHWSEDWPTHACWPSLQARRERHGLSMVVCLPRDNRGFERWFESEGGRVIQCAQVVDRLSVANQRASLVPDLEELQ